MALKANRIAPQGTITVEAQVVQEAVIQEVKPAATSAVVTTQTAKPLAPITPGGVVDMNKDIFENIDGLDFVGNFVGMDGESFVYRGTNPERRVRNITCYVSGGKRFYQWVDESDPASKQFHSSDTKVDDRYKLRFDVKWNEQASEDEEPKEYTMTLPTSSAMNFINFLKDLSKKGYGIGQILLRMSISRQTQQGTTNKYSRCEFEAFTQDGQTLICKTAGAIG